MNALLWIDLLLAGLLWIAFSTAVAGRKRSALGRAVQIVGGFIAPAFVFGGLAGTSLALKFAGHAGVNWLGYTGSLLAVWAIGAGVITIKGMRRGQQRWTPAENWPRAGLAMATAMILVVAGITLMRIDIAVMARASAIDSQAGQVLLALAPQINPDAPNAAPLYTRALEQLQADAEFERAYNAYDPSKPDPAAARALLARRAGSVALLRQASAMRYCRFDYDYAHGINILMPELSAVRQAQWLVGLAVSDEVNRGDSTAALADVGVMFRMSRQVPQAPMAVAALVRADLEKSANLSLEKALPAATSARQLDPLDIAPADFTDVVLPDSIAGEQALGEETISGIITQSADRRHMSGKDSFYFPPPLGTVVRMYLLSDLNSYSAYMTQVGRIADRPWYAVDHAARRRPLALPLGCVADLLRPALATYPEEMALAQACHEEARTAVAIERYRLSRGRLPRRIADLIPTYLAAVPTDPFTGKPMILAKKSDRWIVYSVGPDGKDDGGAQYNGRTKTGDVGFTLRLPAAQPAMRP